MKFLDKNILEWLTDFYQDQRLAKEIYAIIITYQNVIKAPDKIYYKDIQKLNENIPNNLKLYRGIMLDESDKEYYPLKLLNNKKIKLGFIKPTSWSYDINVAKSFALGHSYHQGGFQGFILTLKTTKNNVLLDIHNLPFELQKFPREREVVLLPGEYEIEISYIEGTGKKEYYSINQTGLLYAKLDELEELDISYENMIQYFKKQEINLKRLLEKRFIGMLYNKLLGKTIDISGPTETKFQSFIYLHDGDGKLSANIKQSDIKKPSVAVDVLITGPEELKEKVIKEIEKLNYKLEEFIIKVI